MENVRTHNKKPKGFCDCLPHPFQQDPGTSQPRRVMEELLSGQAKIDARKTADLLSYFYDLSAHINYYDSELNVSDWRPFFEKSIPFVLARMVRYDRGKTKKDQHAYNKWFDKKPSSRGLQLTQFSIYYNTLRLIQNWQEQLKESGLPVERVLTAVIRDKMRLPLLKFISLNQVASRACGVKPISFNKFFVEEAWNINAASPKLFEQSTAYEKAIEKLAECEKLVFLQGESKKLFGSFTGPLATLVRSAEASLEQSFLPLKDELQKKHSPHLALLFSFIKLFEQLQGDLNNYTKKHLDYFYKEVLKIKSKEAVPDKVYLVMAIQKELDQYLLPKGLKAKDGKDINKEEILFGLDDEVVVTQALVKDVRTLFLNNTIVPGTVALTGSKKQVLLEGVYMAVDAVKADGVDQDFQTDVKNYYTVGNKDSKYILPGTNLFKPYPSARLGFILASPVLLLQEGKREITISINCRLEKDTCKVHAEAEAPVAKQCCEPKVPVGSIIIPRKPVVLYRPVVAPKLMLRFVEPLLVKKLRPLSARETIPGKVQRSTKRNSSSETTTRIQPASMSPMDILSSAINQQYYYISEDLISAAQKKGLGAKMIAALRKFLIGSNENIERVYCYCPTEEHRFDATVPVAQFESVASGIDTNNEIIKEFFKKRKPLSVQFSGEKAWVYPKEETGSETKITVENISDDDFTLKIVATLIPEQEAITFYNGANLGEELATEQPLVKIELDDHFKMPVQINVSDIEKKKQCCVERPEKDRVVFASLYHALRDVKLVAGTTIKVHVCGVRNLVVQNEESLMDVNGPVYPFGTRPNVPDFSLVAPVPSSPNLVGPHFYVGSNEILRKKWDDIQINVKWKDKPGDFTKYYEGYERNGIAKNKYEINVGILERGEWKKEKLHQTAVSTATNVDTNDNNRPLFRNDTNLLSCGNPGPEVQSIYLKNNFFPIQQHFNVHKEKLEKFTVNTFDGFLRINLQNQDFGHKDYSFVLARQMTAFGKLPHDTVEKAVYYNTAGSPVVIDSTQMLSFIKGFGWVARKVKNSTIAVNTSAGNSGSINILRAAQIRNLLRTPLVASPPPNLTHINSGNINLVKGTQQLDDFLNHPANGLLTKIENIKHYAAIIPNEPWTPTISGIQLDYNATATLNDIDLIHLLPYPTTYKPEEISQEPMLFPTFCDEGTLFIGIEKLVPGNNLNILFQLAEATADSESEKEDVNWYYLDNNKWKQLRVGFEVLEDNTQDLTTSGIVKFALPENMTDQNTVMPKGLHWIKATIRNNSRAVSETTGISAQAIRATFTNTKANDKSRLATPIGANQVAKLETADAAVKQVSQPYESFGGIVPEEQGMYYVRVSELLRHKGRAIQKFDFERIILEAFPQLFKAKCINHSFGLNAHLYKNDFPYAPGYIITAVIPDLNKLKAGNAFEPKAPVSLLENIDSYVRKKTSPFVRFRAMNPRYEKIHCCIRVQLVSGKDDVYYKAKLEEDIRIFLAPWAIGEFDKLKFGQCVNRSSIIGFMESLDYIDYIVDLDMRHELDPVYSAVGMDPAISVCPRSPRSILVGGNIEICIQDPVCETWNANDPCGNKPIKMIDCKPKPGTPATGSANPE